MPRMALIISTRRVCIFHASRLHFPRVTLPFSTPHEVMAVTSRPYHYNLTSLWSQRREVIFTPFSAIFSFLFLALKEYHNSL